MAGINAGLLALGLPPLDITRADGFVGVMIDDLIVKGAEEPCESQSKRPYAPETHRQIACSHRGRNIG